jgi:hypothetical protein
MKSQHAESQLTITWVTFIGKHIWDMDIGLLGSATPGIRLMQTFCSFFLVPAPVIAGKLLVTNFQT